MAGASITVRACDDLYSIISLNYHPSPTPHPPNSAEIQRDLDRLFVEGVELVQGYDEGHFLEPERQRTMLNVLYIWARRHSPLPSYRQGMHEV
jgi:hypothetical protein